MPNHNPPDPHSRYSSQEISAHYDVNTKYLESPRMQQWQ